MKYIEIITKNMGSCWCGHCYCKVYEDGSIQYTGAEKWQKSERKAPDFAERRSYGSTLKEADYKAAMKKLASPEFRVGYAECGYAATSNDCSYTWREGEDLSHADLKPANLRGANLYSAAECRKIEMEEKNENL